MAALGPGVIAGALSGRGLPTPGHGVPARAIIVSVGRRPSTISRVIAPNLIELPTVPDDGPQRGRGIYRATVVDLLAYERARRPKPSRGIPAVEGPGGD